MLRSTAVQQVANENISDQGQTAGVSDNARTRVLTDTEKTRYGPLQVQRTIISSDVVDLGP